MRSHHVRALVVVAWLASAACASTVQTGSDAAVDAGVAINYGTPAPVATCGGTTCEVGQVCCYRDGRCYTSGDARSACHTATPLPRTPNGPCSSDLDCLTDEFCNGAACLGDGRCLSRSAYICTGGLAPICGCDGVTYADECAMQHAGVRVAADGVCGVGFLAGDATVPAVGCGRTDQCPTGLVCCRSYGLCIEAARCPLARTDGRTACLDNAQCRGAGTTYCAGEGCGTPGYCDPVREPGVFCQPVLDPICGCDGQTYENPCYLRAVGMRAATVDHCGR